MTVQIHDGMPAEVYHADPCSEPSLSSSIAKILVEQSPLHAWHAHPRLNKNHVSKESEDFDRGSATHSLLLEGDDRMVECPYDDWRKKEARELRDRIRSEGKLPMLSKHVETIRKMVEIAKKALADSELGATLEDFYVERTVIWNDRGAWKRARFDLQHKTRPLLMDYKSTTDADPFSFPGLIINNGYDIQAAHYSDAYSVAHPHELKEPEFVFLVQENREPFACSLVGVDPMLMDLGVQKMEAATALWRRCMESGRWPGYSNRIAWSSAPPWAFTNFEARKWINQ
jgi:hypothetical protein